MKHRLIKLFLTTSLCLCIGMTPVKVSAASCNYAPCLTARQLCVQDPACLGSTVSTCQSAPMMRQVLGLNTLRTWCDQLGTCCSTLGSGSCAASQGSGDTCARTDTFTADAAAAALTPSMEVPTASAADTAKETAPASENGRGKADRIIRPAASDSNPSAGVKVDDAKAADAKSTQAAAILPQDTNEAANEASAKTTAEPEASTALKDCSTGNAKSCVQAAESTGNNCAADNTVKTIIADAAKDYAEAVNGGYANTPKTVCTPSENKADDTAQSYSAGNTCGNDTAGRVITYQIPGCNAVAKVVVAPSSSAANIISQLAQNGITQGYAKPTADTSDSDKTPAGQNQKPDADTSDSGKAPANDPSNQNQKPDTNTSDSGKAPASQNQKPDADTSDSGKARANTEDSGKADTVTTPVASTQSDYAARITELVNQERAKQGLSPVTLDARITKAAQVRANETITSFSHTRPNGSSFSSVLKEAGISYRGCGENIAWGQKSPEAVMEAWMNSDGHRANILNPNYKYIGVGYAQSQNGTKYWSQLFTY